MAYIESLGLVEPKTEAIETGIILLIILCPMICTKDKLSLFLTEVSFNISEGK